MSDGGLKTTEAKFVPDQPKGLAKMNSVELMAVVTGVGLCSTGPIGIAIGAPIALGAIYSGFFVPPKFKRGLYLGPCPHCGHPISATHYQEELGCPSCNGRVGVRDSRFVALEKKAAA